MLLIMRVNYAIHIAHNFNVKKRYYIAENKIFIDIVKELKIFSMINNFLNH